MFAQTDLVKEMGNLRKFALRLTGNASDADDLLQSTVLRAMEKQDYFQPDTELFKWTSKIMFNLFVSDYRRKKKFETRYDPENFLSTASIDPVQETKAELHTVQDAMSSLSEEHQEILRLICMQGMRYQEVADDLHIPVGTVRSRLSRAREQLQLLLDHKANEAAGIIRAHGSAGMLESISA